AAGNGMGSRGPISSSSAGPQEESNRANPSNAQQALNATASGGVRPGHPVADAGARDDQTPGPAVGIGRLELPPEAAHVDVEVVALVGVGGAPDRAQQPLLRH